MKKIIVFVLAFVLIAVIGAYTLAFTSFGNDIVKPYVQNAIKEKSGYDVKFNKFEICPTGIDIEAVANSEITAKVSGTLSIFSKNLDLSYDIDVQNLASMGINLKEKMLFSGLIKGKFTDFEATGAGKILGSNATFNSTVKDYSPLGLKLDAKNLELDKALALAGQPLYANGKISLTADISPKDGKPVGSAVVELNDIKANGALLAKDFNLTLPSNFIANGKITADVKDDVINAKSAVITPIATIGSQKTIFEINSQTLSSDVKVVLDDLAKLEPIIKQKLVGQAKIDANVIVAKNSLKNLDATINALGGDVKVALNGEKVVANLESVKLDAILKALSMPAAASGEINGDVRLDSLDFKNLNGVAKLALSNGAINEKQMSELSGKSVPAGLKLTLNAQTNIKNGIAEFDVLAGLSQNGTKNLLELKKLNGSFDINKNSLKSDFEAHASDLKSLSFLTGQNFYGNLNIKGDAVKDGQNLTVNATSKLFEGNMVAKLINNDLNVNLNGFTAKGLTDFLGLSHIYDGVGDMKANYNLASQSGKFNIAIDQGQLVKTGLSETIATFTGKDITTEIYRNGKIDGTINKGLIDFNVDMQANKSKISVTNGKFDTNSKTVNIPLKMNYEKTDIELSVTGTSDAPKYSVGSDYLKNKALKGLDKLIDKKLSGDSNSTKDADKGLLKSLF